MAKVGRGLLVEGTLREVTTADLETPVTIVSYTLPEAAAALGRTTATITRWLHDDLLPPPILRDTTRGLRVYSEGELRLIAEALAVHEREFTYLSPRHSTTIERMHQAMHGYRAQHI